MKLQYTPILVRAISSGSFLGYCQYGSPPAAHQIHMKIKENVATHSSFVVNWLRFSDSATRWQGSVTVSQAWSHSGQFIVCLKANC